MGDIYSAVERLRDNEDACNPGCSPHICKSGFRTASKEQINYPRERSNDMKKEKEMRKAAILSYLEAVNRPVSIGKLAVIDPKFDPDDFKIEDIEDLLTELKHEGNVAFVASSPDPLVILLKR